jgi:hypothetical protein
MQYWTLTGNWIDNSVFFLICVLWALDGWLLVSQAFHLKQQENLVAGKQVFANAKGYANRCFLAWSVSTSDLLIMKSPSMPTYGRYYSGPGGLRTRGLFSAIDKMVGEKGKITVDNVYYRPKSPYNSLRSFHAVSAYLSPNCSRYASV